MRDEQALIVIGLLGMAASVFVAWVASGRSDKRRSGVVPLVALALLLWVCGFSLFAASVKVGARKAAGQ